MDTIEVPTKRLVILGTLPPLWYFVHGNHVYRILERTKEYYCKGARKITHIYVNVVMYLEPISNKWHEVKSRDIEEMDLMTLVEPCNIGPIPFSSGE